MLLDSGDEVYLWVGEESDPVEVSRGLDLAKQYLEADPTPRYGQTFDRKRHSIVFIKEC